MHEDHSTTAAAEPFNAAPAALLVCPACGEECAEGDEPEEDRLYECATEQGCGRVFGAATVAGGTGRSARTGKFGSKLGEGPICPACEEAILEADGDHERAGGGEHHG